MLHDTRNQDILAIAHGIYLNLLTLEIFIDQNRMLLCNLVDDSDILFHILIVDGNLHTLSAQYIGRTNQNRITELVCCFLCLLCGKYGMSLWTRNLAFLQNTVKQLSVLCRIYIFCGSSENLHAHLNQSFCQFDCSLTTELYDCTIRFLDIYNVFHIFWCQRLKIQLIGNIKVCTYSLRVVIDDDCLISLFCKCPGTMYGTEVKLDTLSDTDWSGTKNKDFLSVRCGNCFVFTAIYRIVVWGGSLKLCGTGINHLVGSNNAIFFSHCFYLFFCTSCQFCNKIIRELQSLCLAKQIFRQRLCFQCSFHFHQNCDFINKPYINFRNIMNLLIGNTSADCLCDYPDSSVIDYVKLINQLFVCKFREIIGHQAIYMLFQRTNCLHQSTLEVIADTHNLSSCLHLCCQCSLGTDKLIKWKSWNLNNAVIQHWFKAGIRFSCDCIWNFIQRISQRNLRSDLRDRISGCLRSQCRRTAYTRIYLNHAILKAFRIQCILYVTSTCNVQLADDVQRRSTQHLVLFVSKCLRRSYYDTVSCMHTNRINIFHITYGNAIACAVTHDLVLNFLPSGDATLYQNLSHTRKTKSVFQNLSQLIFVVRDSAAASAKCVCRTKYNRITDGVSKVYTGLYRFYNERSCDWLSDFFHRLFKFQTVFGFFDGLRGCSDQAHIVLLQKSSLLKLHGKVQSCLSSQCWKHAVRLFFDNQLFYNLYGQRLNINSVCNVFIGHNGRRIGVEQNNLNTFLFQRTARLCSGIVKLCRLSNNNRTGTDY